jgi:hypothetical protein
MMLKVAYNLGLQRALEEAGAEQLWKEAQDLGLSVEKLAILGGLGKAFSSLAPKVWGGAKNFAGNLGGGIKGMWTGMKPGVVAPGAAAPGFMERTQSAWKGLAPGQQQAMKLTGAGAVGLGAGSMMGGSSQPPPQSSWGQGW